MFRPRPGCPIDLVCDRSAGSSLLLKPKKIEDIARAMSRSMACPLTLKTRKGYHDGGDVSGTSIKALGYRWGRGELGINFSNELNPETLPIYTLNP